MDGFESREHREEFWESLAERRVPVKFAYSGAASAHQATLSTYHDNVTSLDTELATLSAAGDWLADCREVCEIGPGNGYHTLSLLEYLQGVDRLPERYLATDFSENLMEIATERVAQEFPSLRVDAAQWDVEAGPTEAIEDWRREGPVLVLFVGSTISNPAAPAEILRHVGASMRTGDRLLVQVALWTDPDPAAALESYRRDFFEDGVLAPLEMAGIDKDAGRFEVSLDSDQRTVTGTFHFEEQWTVEYDGDRLSFAAGDAVRCFRSKRFGDEEIRSFLRRAGLDVVEATTTADGAFGTYLGERTRASEG